MSVEKKYGANYGPKGMDLSRRNIGNAVPPAFPRISKTQERKATTPKPGLGWDFGKRTVYPIKPGGKK